MDLCQNGHGEVCFETEECPACEVIREKQSEIDDLKFQIYKLRNEMSDLKDERDSLAEELKDC